MENADAACWYDGVLYQREGQREITRLFLSSVEAIFCEKYSFWAQNRLAWNVYIAVNTSSAHQPKNPEAHALTSQLASRYWRGIKYKLWAQNSDIKWLWDVKGAKAWLLWAAVAIIRNRRSDDTKVHPIWMKGLVSRRLYSWLDTYY